MFEEGLATMRFAIVAAWFVVFCPLLVWAGGAEEKDLECFNRDDHEEVQYESLSEEVDRLFESGVPEVVLCMSAIEAKGNRTVVEVKVIPAGAEPSAQSSENNDILSLGSYIRVHQELTGILGGDRLSPQFPIQMLSLPTESLDFSTVESIASYIGPAILGTNKEAVTYRIGTLREQPAS